MEIDKEICRLCGSLTFPFYGNEFLHCENCDGISKISSSLPDLIQEKMRYDHHQNSPGDGYLNFVAPLLNYIQENIPKDKTGLDYGCGPQSVISNTLTENGFKINKYDPFYENHPSVLENKYDFVIACEVVEHFHHPKMEFERFKNSLKEKGELLIMTHLFEPSISFEKWYYKNDFTHVFFYTQKTLEWIQKRYDFSELVINGRFIRLKN